MLCGQKAVYRRRTGGAETVIMLRENFYLTDLVSIISNKGFKKLKHSNASNDEVMGKPEKLELAQLEGIYRAMKAEELSNNGVTSGRLSEA